MDQEFRLARRRRDAGRMVEADYQGVVDEITTTAVAQQSRAFIDVVSDGMIRWDGPVSRLTASLTHTSTGPLRRWFDTNFYDRSVVVEGALARRQSPLVHDYEVAKEVALKVPVKTTLPGPVLFARMADDRHYADRAALARDCAKALAEEAAALRAAGATWLQLDEPLLCRHPEDRDLVAETAQTVFEAMGPGAETVLSTYFGSLDGLGDGVNGLPGSFLGLDWTPGCAANLEVLRRLPAERGVALGVFDAGTTLQEDAADVAEQLTPHRALLESRPLLVGPNAGLELLPQDHAFDKLLHARYLTEQLAKEWTWAS